MSPPTTPAPAAGPAAAAPPTPEKLEQGRLARLKRAEEAKRLLEITNSSGVKSLGEAKEILKLEDLISTIDADIDLTPHTTTAASTGAFGRRDSGYPVPIWHSVAKPEQNEKLPEENLCFDDRIDWDCDQIRAMIKLFTATPGSQWTLDQFRLVLGKIERSELILFLEQRGPEAGVGMAVYQLAWEFFKRREALGLPLTTTTMAASANNRPAAQARRHHQVQTFGVKRQQIGRDEGTTLESESDIFLEDAKRKRKVGH